VTAPAPASDPNPHLVRATSWEAPSLAERLTRALEAHAAAESHGSATCQQLAERLDDPLSRLLLGLIVDDDRRHESLLHSMVHRLNDDVEPAASSTPESATPLSSEDFPELAADLRGLIRDEHEGARYLRHLGRKEPNLYAGLYQLLLETIARDAEKHALILRFLLRRMEGGAKATT
jgi:hypothetical protein